MQNRVEATPYSMRCSGSAWLSGIIKRCWICDEIKTMVFIFN
jgi:hypothetical protein